MHFPKFDTLLSITYEIVSLGPGYRVQNQTRKAITIEAEPQQDFQPSYLLTIPDAWKVGQLGFWVFVSFVSVQCFLQKISLLFFPFPFFFTKTDQIVVLLCKVWDMIWWEFVGCWQCCSSSCSVEQCAQWFQIAKIPPKIRKIDQISRIFPNKFQQIHLISISGHCMHLIFNIC